MSCCLRQILTVCLTSAQLLITNCLCVLLSVSGVIPELVAKWICGHGMPSSYLCLTSNVQDTKHGISAHTQHTSLLMCRSLSVTSSAISSESLSLSLVTSHRLLMCRSLSVTSSAISIESLSLSLVTSHHLLMCQSQSVTSSAISSESLSLSLVTSHHLLMCQSQSVTSSVISSESLSLSLVTSHHLLMCRSLSVTSSAISIESLSLSVSHLPYSFWR